MGAGGASEDSRWVKEKLGPQRVRDEQWGGALVGCGSPSLCQTKYVCGLKRETGS